MRNVGLIDISRKRVNRLSTDVGIPSASFVCFSSRDNRLIIWSWNRSLHVYRADSHSISEFAKIIQPIVCLHSTLMTPSIDSSMAVTYDRHFYGSCHEENRSSFVLRREVCQEDINVLHSRLLIFDLSVCGAKRPWQVSWNLKIVMRVMVRREYDNPDASYYPNYQPLPVEGSWIYVVPIPRKNVGKWRVQ